MKYVSGKYFESGLKPKRVRYNKKKIIATPDLYEHHGPKFFLLKSLPRGENVHSLLFEGLNISEHNCPDINNFYEVKHKEGNSNF